MEKNPVANCDSQRAGTQLGLSEVRRGPPAADRYMRCASTQHRGTVRDVRPPNIDRCCMCCVHPYTGPAHSQSVHASAFTQTSTASAQCLTWSSTAQCTYVPRIGTVHSAQCTCQPKAANQIRIDITCTRQHKEDGETFICTHIYIYIYILEAHTRGHLEPPFFAPSSNEISVFDPLQSSASP